MPTLLIWGVYTNESVFSTTSHVLFCNQKQYLCFMSCTVVFYTQNYLAPLLSPRCKLTFFMGSWWGELAEGRLGEGSKRTPQATLGCWHCWAWWMLAALLLSNPIPFKKIQQSAGLQKQAGLVQHGIGHGKIIMVLFQLLIIIPPDFLYRSIYLRVPRAVHRVGAGKSPGFLNYLEMGFRE